MIPEVEMKHAPQNDLFLSQMASSSADACVAAVCYLRCKKISKRRMKALFLHETTGGLGKGGRPPPAYLWC